ncbi:MAG: hypothetical protein HKN37_04625 [Rhodothermales bacterium]|nr:hypothetical protein [Rhodothermales bacterium]
MISCLFVSDLHGRVDRYEKLFDAIQRDRPSIVFLGGDLTPHFARNENCVSVAAGQGGLTTG